MPKLNLFLNHHEEGTDLIDFKDGRDYLIYWEGSWFLCVSQWSRGRQYLMSDDDAAFFDTDDFLWTELPEEVEDNG